MNKMSVTEFFEKMKLFDAKYDLEAIVRPGDCLVDDDVCSISVNFMGRVRHEDKPE